MSSFKDNSSKIPACRDKNMGQVRPFSLVHQHLPKQHNQFFPVHGEVLLHRQQKGE